MHTDAYKRFFDAYIEAALWSSTNPDANDEPLDKNHGPSDLTVNAVERSAGDCARFLLMAEGLIVADRGVDEAKFDRWERAGHDFWLTRNGHGAGFWDGDWPQSGDSLTEISKEFHEVNLIVLDDGQIDVL